MNIFFIYPIKSQNFVVNFCQSRISPSAKDGKAQTVSAHIMLENACESSKLREGPKKWGS